MIKSEISLPWEWASRSVLANGSALRQPVYPSNNIAKILVQQTDQSKKKHFGAKQKIFPIKKIEWNLVQFQCILKVLCPRSKKRQNFQTIESKLEQRNCWLGSVFFKY